MQPVFFSTVFFVAFIVLAMMLLCVRIPRLAALDGYRKSRLILGTAFILIAAKESVSFLSPLDGNDEIQTALCQTLFNLAYTFLVYASFLKLVSIAGSKKSRATIIFALGIVAIVLFGLLGIAVEDAADFSSTMMIVSYFTTSTILFIRSLRQYDRFVHVMKLKYIREKGLWWIQVVLWATFGLSMFVVLSSFNAAVLEITKVLYVAVYSFLGVKVLGLVSVLSPVDSAAEAAEAAGVKAVETVPVEEAASQIQPALDSSVQIVDNRSRTSGYLKVESPLDKWVKSEMYTRANVTLLDVAQEIGTNSSYLSTYLNKELGTTFSIWLNRLRVEKSIEFLMSEPAMSIEDCGLKSGFSNIYNYSRWFKQIIGVSPRDYRKEHSESASVSAVTLHS